MRDVLTTTVIVRPGGPGLNTAMQCVVGNPYLHLVVNLIFAAFVVVTVSRAGRMKEYSGAAILIADCLMFFVVVSQDRKSVV